VYWKGPAQCRTTGFERPVHGCGIIETESPVLDTQFCRLAFEFGRIASRENWSQAGLYRQASSRITHKTSGPIQKEIRCHAILSSCSLALNASLRNGHASNPDSLPLRKLTCDLPDVSIHCRFDQFVEDVNGANYGDR
jgi:hypothetical protein